jgi:DNA-binding Lrp family transcriptional regulator
MARHPNGSKEAATARELRAVIMQGHTLDTVDVKILSALQSHGRLSNVELAKKVGLSAPPALRRTAVLEDRGLIKCYRAELNAKMLGFDVTAFITVTLASQSQADITAFEAVMQNNPNIRECHALSGHKDFMIKGVFRDLTETNEFVRDVLLTTPNVRTVNTTFSITRTKHEPAVPTELVEAKLAPSDIKKLRALALRRAAE